MKYFQKILNVVISVFIFIGIPYLCGWAYVFLTWIPSILVFSYLDEEIDNFKIKNSFNFFQGKNNQVKNSEGGIVGSKAYYSIIRKRCAGSCGEILEYESKIEEHGERIFCKNCAKSLNRN